MVFLKLFFEKVHFEKSPADDKKHAKITQNAELNMECEKYEGFSVTKNYFDYINYVIISWSEITACIKIDKPLVVYRFSGSVMK